MRFPGCGVMLADPGFLVAEFVEPAQDLQIPVVALFQSALRRMRGHREISKFHGKISSRVCFWARLVRARESTRLGCGRMMTAATRDAPRQSATANRTSLCRGRTART